MSLSDPPDNSPITDYADLLSHFGAEDFADLNHAVYVDSMCEASISLYGTIALADVDPAEVERVERIARKALLDAECARRLPTLRDHYVRSTTEEQAHIRDLETAYAMGAPEGYIAWARSVIPDAFPEPVITRVPAAYHRGHTAPIPASFILERFTLQTIVDGSDTIVAETFRVGVVTPQDINNWIATLEAEVAAYCVADTDDDTDLFDTDTVDPPHFGVVDITMSPRDNHPVAVVFVHVEGKRYGACVSFDATTGTFTLGTA